MISNKNLYLYHGKKSIRNGKYVGKCSIFPPCFEKIPFKDNRLLLTQVSQFKSKRMEEKYAMLTLINRKLKWLN